MAGINDRGSFMEYDNKGIRLVNGSRFNNRVPILDDHFMYGAGALNSAAPQRWVTTETGAATPFAPSTSVVGGAIVCVTGGTTNNAEEVSSKQISFQASTQGVIGKLWMECRAKFVGATTATDGDFYLGFADANTYTNGLPFVVSAASALTTSAPVEFVGFGYSSIPTSGTLFNSGANFVGLLTEKNSVAGTVQSSAVIKDSNFHTYGLELDAAGNAAFFIDDNYVGKAAACITVATKLALYCSTIAKNSHTHTATIDFWRAGGDLV